MKRFCLFLLSILVMRAYGAEEQAQKPCCPNLQTIAYKATSFLANLFFIRNDYLYLAYSDDIWRLQMKLQVKEEIEDVDRYYSRYRYLINGNDIPIYYTPLHEAVERGHLKAVLMLVDAGADKNKCIRFNSLLPHEKAKHCDTFLIVRSSAGTERIENQAAQEKIEKWKSSHHVGLSALDLAQKLMAEDWSTERGRIMLFLTK